VRPGDRVYLALENDWTWVVGFLAAEAVGAVAVAANTRLATVETAAMLRDAQPSVILVDRWQASKIPAGAYRTIAAADIDTASDEIAPGEPGSPAVLAYSSGTSGEPKGVLLDARSVATSSATYAALFRSTPGMHTAVAVPLFHNTGFVDGLGHALVAGGSVDLMRRFDAEAIARDLASGRLTFFIGVPTMLQRIADLELDPAPPDITPWIAYGGAPMSSATAQAFLGKFPGARLSNIYGLSEVTSLSHYLPHDQAQGRWDAIGIPVPGTRDRIVDGELLVDSPTRMLGYWDAATRSARPARLVDSTWMSTGDLATEDDDGIRRVLGRRDGLINRGGEKIAPREVESALCAFPAVAEAVVVAVPDRTYGSVPGAQIVLAGGSAYDDTVLRVHLSEFLADYKIPVWIDVVDALPRNANGKVHLNRVRQEMATAHREQRA